MKLSHGTLRNFRSGVAADRIASMIASVAERVKIIGEDDRGVVHLVVEPRIARDYFGDELGSDLDSRMRLLVEEKRMRWRYDDDTGRVLLRLTDAATGTKLNVHVTPSSTFAKVARRLADLL